MLVPIVPGEDLDAWFTRYIETKPSDEDARHAAGFHWRKWFSTRFGSRAAGPFTAEDIESMGRTILRGARSREEAWIVWGLLLEIDKALSLSARTKPKSKDQKFNAQIWRVGTREPVRQTSDKRDPVDEAAWAARLKKTWLYK